MVDIISALQKKRVSLTREKQRIHDEAQRRMAELDAEIEEVDKARETINNAVKDLLCPTCKGTGSVRRCDAAGSMEDDVCPTCHGTGVKTKEAK